MTKRTWLLLSFIIAKIVFQFLLIHKAYELHRDEFLHLDQGRHLDWGYLSVPPVSSWIAFIIRLLGNDEFWVKFFPAAFGALTILVVWKTIEALNGGLFALALGAISIFFSVIMRINLLFQPNSLDILIWATACFVVVKYIQDLHSKWFYYLAVVLALGFLNKYNIVFFLAGLLPALIITKHRVVFLNRHFYYAILLAILLVSPNIAWQYNNNFPVFSHMKELAATQLENINRADFIKEQVIFFIGSFYVLIAAFIAYLFYEPFKTYRIFFWSFIFTLILFIYLKAKGYYAIGLYPIQIAFGAVYLESILQTGWKRYLKPVALLIPPILFFGMIKFAFPINKPEVIQQDAKTFKDLGLLRWEDGKDHHLPQDFADMLGWKELAHKTDSAIMMINDPDHTLVLTDNYGQAGAINCYSGINNMQAVTFNADYINWFPLQKEIRHIILVKEENNDPAGHTRGMQFASVSVFDKITNPFAREKGTTIYVYKNAETGINQKLEKMIYREKHPALP